MCLGSFNTANAMFNTLGFSKTLILLAKCIKAEKNISGFSTQITIFNIQIIMCILNE